MALHNINFNMNNNGHGNEVLPRDTTHLIQKPCYQRGSPCQDPAGDRTTRWFGHFTSERTVFTLYVAVSVLFSGRLCTLIWPWKLNKMCGWGRSLFWPCKSILGLADPGQNTQEIKRTLFSWDGTGQNVQIFDVIIFFKLRTIQQKTVKPTYLCSLGAKKLAKGKGFSFRQLRGTDKDKLV